MKKTFLTLLAFSAITISAIAQQQQIQPIDPVKHTQCDRSHKHGMDMQALNLTADQKAKLKAYNQSFRTQMDSLRKNENITVKQSRDQEYALRQQRKANFESILTADQKAKLKQLKDDRMAQHDSTMSRHLDRMKTKLGLTDEQVAQIKAQHDAIREKIIAIRNNDNLTREQKEEQLSSIKNERKDAFKKILTPDQLNKLEQMKKARMEKNNS
jgi:Spy/CpxP family protein refolding chaperone